MFLIRKSRNTKVKKIKNLDFKKEKKNGASRKTKEKNGAASLQIFLRKRELQTDFKAEEVNAFVFLFF